MAELREIPQERFREIESNPDVVLAHIDDEFYQSGEPSIMPSFYLTLYESDGTYYIRRCIVGEKDNWFVCMKNDQLKERLKPVLAPTTY